jgi:hypothetical protein
MTVGTWRFCDRHASELRGADRASESVGGSTGRIRTTQMPSEEASVTMTRDSFGRVWLRDAGWYSQLLCQSKDETRGSRWLDGNRRQRAAFRKTANDIARRIARDVAPASGIGHIFDLRRWLRTCVSVTKLLWESAESESGRRLKPADSQPAWSLPARTSGN